MTNIRFILGLSLALLLGCSRTLDGRERSAQILFVTTTDDAKEKIWRSSDNIKQEILAGGQFVNQASHGYWVLYGAKGGPYEQVVISYQNFAHGNGIMIGCAYSSLYSDDMEKLKVRVEHAIGSDLMRNVHISADGEPIMPIMGDGSGG